MAYVIGKIEMDAWKAYQAANRRQLELEKAGKLTGEDCELIQCEVHNAVEDFFELERYSTDLAECDELEKKMVEIMSSQNKIIE